jgi:hypothetical protein
MLASPLATSGQTRHRFRMSRLDSALGRRKLSLGRSENPRRVTQARTRRLRTHGVAVSATPTTGAVTDVAYLPRESPRPVHVPETSRYAPGGDDVADGSGLTFRQTPLSCDAQYASHRCAVGKCPSFQRTLPASISFKITFTTRITIRTSSGRGPPTHGQCGRPTCMPAESIGAPAPDLCDERRCRTIDRGAAARHRGHMSSAYAPPRGCFTAVGVLARYNWRWRHEQRELVPRRHVGRPLRVAQHFSGIDTRRAVRPAASRRPRRPSRARPRR